MEIQEKALFIQKMSRKEHENRMVLSFKLIGILVVPMLLSAILFASTVTQPLGNYMIAVFILLAVVIVAIMLIRWLSVPRENLLIVYPDGIYFYSTFLRGKHIYLKEDEILSINKIIDNPQSRQRILQDAKGTPGLGLARMVEETSPLFQTIVHYTLLSTKVRMPFPFSFLWSEWHSHSWFLVVEARNEADFLQAIRQSHFSDRLNTELIGGWDEFWKERWS